MQLQKENEDEVPDLGPITVRKARLGDEKGVYEVACSVSCGKKDSHKGFLMDNYSEDPQYYLEYFRDRIKNLNYFFVAEMYGRIVGFTLSYRKSMWVRYNPEWIRSIKWHPAFKKRYLEDFVLIDKIAVSADYTGEGIGGMIENKLKRQMKAQGVRHILSETLVDPTPNLASISFREKQDYRIAGMRYEEYKGEYYTDLVYWKKI
ncbi:MAG: GNAT family N-acetyltransferase [Gudongella sp.]|jgi:predicted GNAT superfamily acetyltransferase|nr:GNAT family N-acetyltransferase [Gudongella sp.]